MKKREKGLSLIISLIISYIFIVFSSSLLIYLYQKKEIFKYIAYRNVNERKKKDIIRMEFYLSKKLNLNNNYFDIDNEMQHIYLTNNTSIGGYRIKNFIKRGEKIYLTLTKMVLDVEIIVFEIIEIIDEKVNVKEIKIEG